MSHHLWNSTTELILWNSQLLPTEFFLLFLTLIFQFTKSNILILIGYSKTAFVLQIPNYSLRKLKFIAPGFSQQKKSLDYLDNPIFFVFCEKDYLLFFDTTRKLDLLWWNLINYDVKLNFSRDIFSRDIHKLEIKPCGLKF